MYKDKIKIGIVGCGAIGSNIAKFIDKELKDKVILYALCDLDIKKTKNLIKKLSSNTKILDIDSLIKESQLIIETASIDAANYIINKAVKSKKDLIILSVGVFVKYPEILKTVMNSNLNLCIPSGAICGVDGLGALSLGEIKNITITTSKPIKGFSGSNYLKEKNIDIDNIKEEKIIFKGDVKDAIRFFPQNINVAATLLLASNFKDIKVCIKLNPNINRNIHHIEIDAKEAKISIDVKNIPSEDNPKTSSLAILSTKYLLKKMFSSFRVGS